MNGLTIFSHSFRQVTGNLGMAIRASGGFWLLTVVAGFVYGFIIALTSSTFLAFVLGLAFLVFVVWGISLVAVVWHRYVLLEEQPSGFLPYREGMRVWSYFWYGVGIILIVLLLLLVLFFVASLFMEPRDILRAFDQLQVSFVPIDMALRFIVGLLASLIYLRLALILPAVALDKSLTIGASWTESKPYTGAIIVLAFALALVNGGVTLLSNIVLISAQGNAALSVLVSLVSLAFQWFYFMLNISILSTLYGHIVQKREVY